MYLMTLSFLGGPSCRRSPFGTSIDEVVAEVLVFSWGMRLLPSLTIKHSVGTTPWLPLCSIIALVSSPLTKASLSPLTGAPSYLRGDVLAYLRGDMLE